MHDIPESELPKATSTSALSGAGVLRLFNKVGETVNKITYKMDESDPVSNIYFFNMIEDYKIKKNNYITHKKQIKYKIT